MEYKDHGYNQDTNWGMEIMHIKYTVSIYQEILKKYISLMKRSCSVSFNIHGYLVIQKLALAELFIRTNLVEHMPISGNQVLAFDFWNHHGKYNWDEYHELDWNLGLIYHKAIETYIIPTLLAKSPCTMNSFIG